MKFLQPLTHCRFGFVFSVQDALRRYDFEFWAWPTDFNATVRDSRTFLGQFDPVTPACAPAGPYFLPHRVLGWFMINTFGLKLIYPGSTRWLLQPLIGPVLAESRSKLVNAQGGKRVKVNTEDGNSIDAMYFDRRG